MSFSLHLTPDLVPVEAGATVPATVTLENRGAEADRFEVQVEGLDPEWIAVPVPIIDVEAGVTQTEKIFFKPRRASESLAGNYPFVLRVRSLNSGESRTAQGVLQIKPFHHLSMEINPKKGMISPLSRRNAFAVSLANLGNTPHIVQLSGTDPEDACTYEFENERVDVGPGAQREVEVLVTPRSSRPFSGTRLIGFNVTGRSSEVPSIVASTQAQLEQRPLIGPAGLLGLLLLGLLLGAWLFFKPQPPTVDLIADKTQVMQGEKVTLTWKATNAQQVRIQVGGKDVPGVEGPSGSTTYVAKETGDLTFTAVAVREGRQSEPDTLTVSVEEKPIVLGPTVKLEAPREAKLNEAFTLKYTVTNAEKVTLTPDNIALDPAGNEVLVTPRQEGETEYTIVATSKEGKTARDSARVRVVDPPLVSILEFRATPKEVVADPEGTTTLTWQLTGAVRTEIVSNAGMSEVVESAGSRQVTISKTTTFRITGIDTKGKRKSQAITVRLRKPTLPEEDPNPIEPPPGEEEDPGGSGGVGPPETGGGPGMGMRPPTGGGRGD